MLTTKGQPYGTGALVAWQEREAVPNATLVLRNNKFLFAEGCGDRAVVAIGGCERVLIVGTNTIQAGGEYPALALDPLRGSGENGPLISSLNGTVYVAPLSEITGHVTLRGRPATQEQMDRLQRLR